MFIVYDNWCNDLPGEDDMRGTDIVGLAESIQQVNEMVETFCKRFKENYEADDEYDPEEPYEEEETDTHWGGALGIKFRTMQCNYIPGDIYAAYRIRHHFYALDAEVGHVFEHAMLD